MYSSYNFILSNLEQVLDNAYVNLENNYLTSSEQRQLFSEIVKTERQLESLKSKLDLIKKRIENTI